MKSPEEFAQSAGMQTFQCLVNCVQACVDSGAFRKIDILAASQAMWCAVHGVTSLLITQCGFPFIEQEHSISTVLNAMIDGYRASRTAAGTIPEINFFASCVNSVHQKYHVI